MPTTRLVTRLVTTTACISSGAVLTLEGKTATTAEGLGVIDELFDLLAETVATKNQHTEDERDEIVRFLKRCTRRYGTVRGAMDAIGDRRRTHPLISREKANAWSSVMSVIASAIETQLKRHPSLKVHISRWLSDQGSPIEDRLKLYTDWLDAPFPEAGATPDHASEDEGDPSPASAALRVDTNDERALELYALLLADKRPGLSPGDRCSTEQEAALRDELADSDNAFARLCVALSSHDFAVAEQLIRKFAGSIDGEFLHTLRGECAYGSGRFSDAVGHYRVALTHCMSPECALSLALSLGRADIGTNEERTREALDVLTSLRDRQDEGDPARVRTLVAVGNAHLHNPSGDRDANVLLAIEALETALESIDRGLSIEETSGLYYIRGIQLERLGDVRGAQASFSRAFELDPTSLNALLASAESLVDMGLIERARAALLSNTDRFGYSAGLQQALGHIAMLDGDLESAAKHFNEAAVLDPESASIAEDLARISIATGRFAEAEFSLARLLERASHKSRRDLQHMHARTLIELDRPVEARAILRSLTRSGRGASDEAAWSMLVDVALMLGDLYVLDEASRQLTLIAPDRRDGHLARAIYLHRVGRSDEALAVLAALGERIGGPDETTAQLEEVIRHEIENPTGG